MNRRDLENFMNVDELSDKKPKEELRLFYAEDDGEDLKDK